MLLILLQACGSTTPEDERVAPRGIISTMHQLRSLSAEFKRACVTENRSAFPSLAGQLLKEARKLTNVKASPPFHQLAALLVDRANAMAYAPPDEKLSRMKTRFNDFTAACIACHQAYGKE